MEQLGWANDWTKTPEVVKKCWELRHQPTRNDIGPPYRGLDNVVKCDICKYVYHYACDD